MKIPTHAGGGEKLKKIIQTFLIYCFIQLVSLFEWEHFKKYGTTGNVLFCFYSISFLRNWGHLKEKWRRRSS